MSIVRAGRYVADVHIRIEHECGPDGSGSDMAKAKAVTIYGIKNCDTMKKARSWLDARGVAYAFHDYKAAGIERGMLEAWVREVSWETLLNRAGTHVPQIGLERQERTDRKEGRHADARSAIDDQTARARRGWQVARRVQAGSLRKGICTR